jgi:hypothetical protein
MYGILYEGLLQSFVYHTRFPTGLFFFETVSYYWMYLYFLLNVSSVYFYTSREIPLRAENSP